MKLDSRQTGDSLEIHRLSRCTDSRWWLAWS
jgi:hypothetical protein